MNARNIRTYVYARMRAEMRVGERTRVRELRVSVCMELRMCVCMYVGSGCCIGARRIRCGPSVSVYRASLVRQL